MTQSLGAALGALIASDWFWWALWIVVLLYLFKRAVRVNWLRSRLRAIPAVGGLLGFAVGVFISAVTTPGPAATHIYNGLELLLGNGDWTKPVLSNAQATGWLAFGIHFARLAAPLATLSLIFYLFRDTHSFLLYLTRARSEHVVLCGLGEAGWQFVRGWEREGCREVDLIIVEKDEDQQRVEDCRSKGFTVIVGDARQEGVLRKARVDRASALINLLPEEELNIDLAITARRFVEQRRAVAKRPAWIFWGKGKVPKPLNIYVHVDNTWLSGQMQYHSRFKPEHVTATRFMNLYELGAREAICAHPPDIYADLLDSPEVHIAIYGFGRMGEAVLVQALKQCNYLNRAAMRFSIFDRDVARCEETFRKRYAGVAPALCRVLFFQLNEAEAGVMAADLQPLGEPDASPPVLHFVCFDRDETSMTCAIILRNSLQRMKDMPDERGKPYRAWNAPVLVRLRSREGIGRALLPIEPAEGACGPSEQSFPDNLHPFGMLDDGLQPTVLIDEVRDQLGRTLHEHWFDLSAPTIPPEEVWRKEGGVAWHYLSNFLKASNRAQADHLEAKLRAVRCRAVAGRECADPTRIAAWWRGETTTRQGFVHEAIRFPAAWAQDSDRCEQLARMEKTRWNAFHIVSGWRHGENRVNAARVHPDILPWEDGRLSEQTKDKDRDHVVAMAATILGSHSGLSGVCRTVPPTGIGRQRWIGVIGHRPHRLFRKPGTEADRMLTLAAHCRRIEHVIDERAQEIAVRLKTAAAASGGCTSFTIVTGLAEGADRLLTRSLLTHLNDEQTYADLVVLLPLPFELFRIDFGDLDPANVTLAEHWGVNIRDLQAKGEAALWPYFDVGASIREFANLAGCAARVMEAPLRFGGLETLGWKTDNQGAANAARDQQYALANAYMVQRCDELVAVWDGAETQHAGSGGTGDAIREMARSGCMQASRESWEPLARALAHSRTKTGGIAETIQWWLSEEIPEEYSWCNPYHELPAREPIPHIIVPSDG